MRLVAVVMGACAIAGSAYAQDDTSGWRVNVGAGGVYAPAYEGDDDYRLSIVPSIEVGYGERFDASIQNGARYRLVNTPEFRLGPIGRVRFSRSDDGEQAFAVTGEDTDDLRGLGDVDTSIELGVFAEYELGAVTLSAEARQAVSGHESWLADIGASWRGRASISRVPLRWSIGPRARFVGDDYNDAYFGIDGGQSIASGLPVYDAGGGLHSYGVAASVVAPLSSDGKWALVGFASFDTLVGDAADSPLVRERGAAEQGALGIVLSRRL